MRTQERTSEPLETPAVADPPAPPEAPAGTGKRGKPSADLRRRVRTFARSPLVTRIAGRLVYGALQLVYRTQRQVAGSSDSRAILSREHPAIVALWHGQHFLAPFFRPPELPYVALLSRNADAEINAVVVERFGIETVRGSGGRVRRAVSRKGGARALLQLVRMLEKGFGVCMIADVVKGVPREAGLGVVTLARLSGRPIVPAAAVTSRRLVLRKTWDRTTVPLPFGRIAVVMGEPIHVPPDADEAEIERVRREVTRAIEAANAAAMRLADGGAPPGGMAG